MDPVVNWGKSGQRRKITDHCILLFKRIPFKNGGWDIENYFDVQMSGIEADLDLL